MTSQALALRTAARLAGLKTNELRVSTDKKYIGSYNGRRQHEYGNAHLAHLSYLPREEALAAARKIAAAGFGVNITPAYSDKNLVSLGANTAYSNAGKIYIKSDDYRTLGIENVERDEQLSEQVWAHVRKTLDY
jgi:hypothetical protein